MVEAVDWAVAGSYFEACNCEAICPCRSVGGRPGGRSTYGVCEFTLSWHIARGHAGDVDLAGLDLVLAGFYRDDDPGSPWSVILYVDDRAEGEQQRWLSKIFLGRAGGGTRSNFAASIATVHAVRRATIELDHEPASWAIGIEGLVRVRAATALACDETVACGIPGLDRPGQELVADVMAVDDVPLAWDVKGRCAFATDFDYRSGGSDPQDEG
ncbi:MAG TPA: DUF1326 domain-containing protein [Acidimicrobiales bacterium]|nr:DUF1326 domain-containing protein [Acidimicrobiales bacterium]